VADKRSVRRNVSRLVGALFAVLALSGFVWFVNLMMSVKSNKPTRQIQTVQIIRPPPPPPPDEPPPPPPPEKTPEALPKDEPEPTPDNSPPPADQPLGVDAEGTAGGDAFGLAARSGGSDLVGGTGSAPYARYQNQISDVIRERLSSVACAKNAKGSLTLHLLMDAAGHFKQVQLATTTGNRQTDQCIETALGSLPAMGEPLPPGMPEQVNVKIVARI
jgi:periplasmic protein TonB